MNYVDIVNLVFTIIFGISSVLYIHFFIFGFLGVFFKRKFPKAKIKHKFGIVIPCRNEGKVVANLVNSILKSNYPKDKLNIYVMAHNCTDDTAEQARKLGVTVYEYNNDNERTKGYALKYLFEQLKKDLPNGIEENEGYFIFDADNLVTLDYFDKMNDAFEANKGQKIITSFRNSKNYGRNLMSGCYGLFFMYGCRLDLRGRAVCNVSSRIYGTGFVIPSEILVKKDGWHYLTIVEDFEFTADQIIEGNNIAYCDEAEFYDEQPTTFKVMWRQRVRWAKGRLLCTLTSLNGLIKSLFSFDKKYKNKVSLYDMTVFVLPLCLILTSLSILQFILLNFSPLFGLNYWAVMSTWLISTLKTFAFSYLGTFLTGLVVMIAEHKRIHGVSFIKKIGILLMLPLFMFLQFFLDLVALFSKNLKWKEIPHNDSTNIENIGGQIAENMVSSENSEV